jgi:hypothetical protein
VNEQDLEKVVERLTEAVKPGSMIKKAPLWLGDVAACDAKLAWTLREMGRAPGGYIDTGGWELIPISASWTAGTVNTTQDGSTQGIVEAELWVREVTYTVRRPEAFSGNVLKSLSDVMNSLQPNIDFTLNIKSYCNYLIATQPVPLETIRSVFSTCCPAGLVLRCGSQIEATFTNRRAFSDAELPVDVAVVLHAIRLPRDMYGLCTDQQAQALLQELGLK